MRLFIAINFPDEIKTIIAKVRDSIKDNAIRGSFSFDENLHLTLVFLGECDFRQTEIIKSVMNETKFSNFTLTTDKVGFFKRDGGDIWWISLKENRPLSDLQANLTNNLISRGFNLDSRKYTPHITFGRQVKLPAGFVRPEIQNVNFNISSIELMKSERINGKLTYTPVFSLASK